MKISKKNAEITAESMVKPKRKELADLYKKMQSIAVLSAAQAVAQEIAAAAKKHAKYFDWNDSVEPFGEGINDRHMSFKMEKSIPSTSSWKQPVELKGKVLQNYKDTEDKYKAKEREIRTLLEDIYKAILGFKTDSRLKKEWPEAYQHYPERVETGVSVIDVKSIMQRL